VIKSRRKRWSGHVTSTGEGRGVYRVLVGNLREGDHWGDPGIDGRIILAWIFGKLDVGVWTGWNWLRIGTGACACECGDEPSGSIKCGEFLD
jgi:hypothetical protein